MKQEKKNQLRQDIVFYLMMVMFYGIFFRVIYSSGLSADDMWNSNYWASKYTGTYSVWQSVVVQFWEWLRVGRFFPVSNLGQYVFVVCPSVVSYKIALVIATYVDNLVCSLCLKELTKSRWIAYLYIMLFPVLIQLTPEFDSGLYCYHMLIQTVVLFCLLSLFGLVRYADTRKVGYMILSMICFLLALNTYEVAFVFIFVLLYVAYERTHNLKRAVLLSIPDGIVFLIMCMVNVAIRIWYQSGAYDGIMVHWNVKDIIMTLFKQCSTCIPLVRYFAAWIKKSSLYEDVYQTSLLGFLGQIQVLDIVLLLCFAATLWYVMRYTVKKDCADTSDVEDGNPFASDNQGRNLRILLMIGGILYILPGGLIAISAKYQQTLWWGAGHLPAYMQSLGFTMLVVAVFYWIYRRLSSARLRKWYVIACGCLAGIMILLSQVSSRQMTEYINGYRKYPQENIAYASEAGLFDAVADQENKIVIGTTSYIYDTSCSRQFYSKFAKKNIYAMERNAFFTMILDTENGQTPIGTYMDDEEKDLDIYDLTGMEQEYYGVFNLSEQKDGAIIMGRCVELDYDTETGCVEHLWIEQPSVYIRGDGKRLTGVDSSDWQLQTSGDDYAIYELSGRYDIIQDSEYYNSETEEGVLYR